MCIDDWSDQFPGGVLKWEDDGERLCVFRRRDYQRFSRVPDVAKKPFEFNSYAVNNALFFAVEVVS
jgi:hypothetical protein